MKDMIRKRFSFERLLPYLPAPFRRDKLPYVFLFAVLVIGVLLLFSAISPYQNSAVLFELFAVVLVLLLTLVYFGMPINWAVHLGTGVGSLMMIYATWSSGGIHSPRMAWLLILPLTPFYVISRKAGGFWMAVVILIQVLMAALSATGHVPPFEPGVQHAVSSYVTYTLVTFVLIIVPLIYDHQHRRALNESRAYQRELEFKRQELEYTLQMREHFIATVSHELRTPMNAILGFNALLLSQLEGKPEARKVLNHTRQSADHLMTVINDILDYSQLQSGELVVQPEVFELRQTVQHAFDLFGPRVNSMSIAYRIELASDLPVWVNTDRHRLMQILVNLLGNALKFTHQGEVVLSAQQDSGGVLFAVQDSGIGIAQDRQAQIFNRFSQAHGDIQVLYGGNGLGLAISRKLVQLLGGDMGLESTQGVGSRFWFRLPLKAVASPVQVSSQTDRELRTQDMAWQFLVVDDHPVNRLLVKQVLQNAWPRSAVLEADNGAKALALLRTQGVDMVFMDMVMPVMDGIEATAAIRRDLPEPQRHTPVMGLTANVNPVDLDAFKAAGLNAILLKPFESTQLCLEIERLITLEKPAPAA